MSIFDRLNEWFDELRVPEYIDQQLNDCEQLLQQEDYIAAHAHLVELEARHPNIWRTQFLLGLICESLGRLDEAASYYQQANDIRTSAISLTALARVQQQRGSLEHVRELLYQAVQVANHPAPREEALEALAQFHEDLSEWNQAASAWARLGTMNSSCYAPTREAEALRRAGESERAIQLLRKKSEKDHEASLLLVDMLLELDSVNTDEITRHLEAIPRESRHWKWFQYRGLLAVQSNEIDHGISALYEAAGEAPTHEYLAIHTALAHACLLADDAERALLHAEAAAMLDPGSDASTYAVKAAISLGKIDIAEEHAKDIQTSSEDEKYIRILMAQAYLDYDRIGDAQAMLTPLGWAGASPELRLLRAQLALQSGDPAEALTLLHDLPAAYAPERVQPLLTHTLQKLSPELPEANSSHHANSQTLQHFLQFLLQITNEVPELAEYGNTLRTLRTAIDQPLSVGVIGEFNAGKSTLINAWLGEEMLATGVLPTTSHVNRMGYGPHPVALVIFDDGTQEEYALDQMSSLIDDAPQPIDTLEFRFPHPTLRAVHIWDTPGFNAPDDKHEERAEEALESADAVLWVLDARQALSQSEFSRIESVPGATDKLLVAINKIDQFDDEEQAAIREHVTSSLDIPEERIFAISARDALCASLDEAEEPEGFQRLRNALDTYFFARARPLKVAEILRRTIQLVQQMSQTASSLHDSVNQKVETLGRYAGTSLEQWQKHLFQIPRALTRSLGEGLEATRSQMLEALERSESGVRILGTTVGARVRPATLEALYKQANRQIRRTHERAVAILVEETTRLEQEAVALIEQLSADLRLEQSRLLRRRSEAYLTGCASDHQLLREQLVERPLISFDARFEAVGSSMLTRIAADNPITTGTEPNLVRLLPRKSHYWQEIIEQWLEHAHSRHTELILAVSRDLEIQALNMQHRVVQPLENTYKNLQELPTQSS